MNKTKTLHPVVSHFHSPNISQHEKLTKITIVQPAKKLTTPTLSAYYTTQKPINPKAHATNKSKTHENSRVCVHPARSSPRAMCNAL